MSEKAPGCVLITGAALRIGRAVALDLGRRGWRVAVHYHRSRDAAEQVAAEVASSGGQAAVVAADLADMDQTMDLLPRAATALGPIDCLINNASIFEDDSAQNASPDSWNRHFAINVRAPFFLAQALAAALGPEDRGSVINMIDQRVWKPTPAFFSYTNSKAALWSVTQTLAMALAPRVRVNGVGPGPTIANVFQSPEAFAEEFRSTPLRRGAEVGDICDAVRYLLGAEAVTGQMIAVDGGQHLPWAPPEDGG